jgi:hypothetical protein
VVSNARSRVCLVFTPAPLSKAGPHEISVRVKAEMAAPVPIKVKYLAVGAG